MLPLLLLPLLLLGLVLLALVQGLVLVVRTNVVVVTSVGVVMNVVVRGGTLDVLGLKE